ncbi:hyoscyamine 6-dioxygenase-like [Diospyros lotus]|uniref:hyoscyamine 6-dioxygenase-like n=1 Tax=Diospyros lotus TaxID=55363 RepID=UPI0022595B68|nr:hyoscyamine 6-dioxygenase-like [Diospyros lotus]XP_052169966.1 hyoscyamine 6-dioxygenase-like [Diospyros lotus]
MNSQQKEASMGISVSNWSEIEKEARFVSDWSKHVQSLPEDYVFPPGQRPGKLTVLPGNSPVIDLNQAANYDPSLTAHQILEASREFGFFQVTNHGISKRLTDEAIGVAEEFFEMPAEVKASVFTPDAGKSCRLYTSSFVYDTERFHFWRDNLTHPCHASQDCFHLWPLKPARYREVIGEYTVEVNKLLLRILDLIQQGLGLEYGFFREEMRGSQLLAVNHYPPCPDPSLALGAPRHSDPNLISIINDGGKPGIQFLKDGQWFNIEPIPNSFTVFIGCQLQIISNDKLRSAEHRVVTSSERDRTTLCNFMIPSEECFIEPERALVSASNPPVYRGLKYKEFLNIYAEKLAEYQAVMESCKLQASTNIDQLD